MDDDNNKVALLALTDLVQGVAPELTAAMIAETIHRNTFSLVAASYDKAKNDFPLSIDSAMRLSVQIFCKCYTNVDLAEHFMAAATAAGAANVYSIITGQIVELPLPAAASPRKAATFS